MFVRFPSGTWCLGETVAQERVENETPCDMYHTYGYDTNFTTL